jgi:diguanylate cyclase (GGDEF)-like protein/PAS domain S-box-containing protein
MRSFADWSIRHKLTGLFLLVALFTALGLSAPIAFFNYVGDREAMAKDLATLGDALGRNSTAALTFHDARAANDTLDALRAEPSVTAACIYETDGKVLARYVRPGSTSQFVPPPMQGPSRRFASGRLLEFRPIVLNGDIVGTIYIESDLERLDQRLRQYAIVFIATFLLTLVLAMAISFRLQRPISAPLAALVSAASKISTANDYTIRAHLNSRDEFGVLGSAFNTMLDQIERRDQDLLKNGQKLENEVASRTAELLLANKQLRRAEEKYRAIFEDAVIGIFQLAPDGRPISINRAMAQICGYDSPTHLLAEITNLGQEILVDPSKLNEILHLLAQEQVVRELELELYHRDRSRKWVLANIRAVRDSDGQLTLLEGTIEDITDRKRAQEQVQFLAYYDALTGLANRTLLQDRLRTALANAQRHGEKVALLFLDLDRFKIINDSLGHSFGDLLLQEVAERLKRLGRAQDTVARIGGDEFLFALSSIKAIPDAAVVAERVMNAMTHEFAIQNRKFHISCSIGISIYPEHGVDAETLIKNADAAMYSAKEGGRNMFRFFSADMNTQVVERLTIEHDLRMALERNELFLLYQPQAEIATGKITGFEALLRWKHPTLGLVQPDKFIKVAENSGLIVPIGEWVLKTACSFAKGNQRAGIPPVPVAVNVSAVQFRQEGFLKLVSRVLQEAELAPEFLELELTESLLLENADVTLSLLQALKRAGVRLSIDDFGTGYSNLSYLRQFPVSKLKIDRSFIQNVASNPDDAAIAKAVINMARGLNLKVIAEGVENESQLSFLRAHGCSEIQGYYLSKPLLAEEVAVSFSNVAVHV